MQSETKRKNFARKHETICSQEEKIVENLYLPSIMLKTLLFNDSFSAILLYQTCKLLHSLQKLSLGFFFFLGSDG